MCKVEGGLSAAPRVRSTQKCDGIARATSVSHFRCMSTSPQRLLYLTAEPKRARPPPDSWEPNLGRRRAVGGLSSCLLGRAWGGEEGGRFPPTVEGTYWGVVRSGSLSSLFVVCRVTVRFLARARALCGCGGCAPEGERGRNQSDDGRPTSKDEDTIVGALPPGL